jgi:molybdate transport system permease protein
MLPSTVTSRTPRGLTVVAALGAVFLLLPLLGIVRRVAWSSLWQQLTSPQVTEALRLSLLASILATLCALVLGFPLAWILARANLRGRSLLRALVTLPMVMPPVVGGIALLGVYGRTNGLLGSFFYDTFGVQVTFSLTAVVIAETFVALPFLVLAIEGGLRSIDLRYEESAAVMGAGPWQRLTLVTFKLLRPSLIAGVAVAWARALGEFGATITFAGNIEGRTQTTPLAVYMLLESDPEAAYALSLVLVLVCVGVLFALRDQWLGRRS